MAKISSVLSASASIVRLLGSLFALWLTLGWNVRKARKAFENELIAQGMSRVDARKLSAHIENLKDEIMSTFGRSVIGFSKKPMVMTVSKQ
jgi:hypothetical protein